MQTTIPEGLQQYNRNSSRSQKMKKLKWLQDVLL